MHRLQANLRVAFTYMEEEIVKKIVITFIRPNLEYAAVEWNPHLKRHIKKLEKYKEQQQDGYQV